MTTAVIHPPDGIGPVLGGSEGCRIRKDEPFESSESAGAMLSVAFTISISSSFSHQESIKPRQTQHGRTFLAKRCWQLLQKGPCLQPGEKTDLRTKQA